MNLQNIFHFQGLVIAGLADLSRPAEAISPTQSAALAATGIVWSRYSLVITPKNYSLFSVNLFVALTQSFQIIRAIKYEKLLSTIFGFINHFSFRYRQEQKALEKNIA